MTDESLKKLRTIIDELSEEERSKLLHYLDGICPEDSKYGESVDPLREYLSSSAEWRVCAEVQRTMLETRVEFGCAPKISEKLDEKLSDIQAINMHLLEGILRHDQLAVIKELGRTAGEDVEALLHPGTTSYDVLDTARAYLFKQAWSKEVKPVIKDVINKLCDLAERSKSVLQVGRTHLQHTSPVTFGSFFASYASRLAERLSKADLYFNDLKGKISGITGTGAGIEQVIGEGRSIEFEKRVLEKLGLEPDYTATQITQKEKLADVGHGLVTLVHVLGDFANDVRILYSSDIGELTSLDNAKRLGGSSTDASKNNPINWEHIAGMAPVVESGMRVLYELIHSDLQRDLRSSVQARYQPQTIMAQTYRLFKRASKGLGNLSIIEDRVAENLQKVRGFPSEAMVTILRGEGFTHSKYGVGHDFVKEISKAAKKNKTKLMDEALKDAEFMNAYNKLTKTKQEILNGELENYLGSLNERIEINIEYARSQISILDK